VTDTYTFDTYKNDYKINVRANTISEFKLIMTEREVPPVPEVYIEPADSEILLNTTHRFNLVVDGAIVENIRWAETGTPEILSLDREGCGDTECNYTGLEAGETTVIAYYEWFGREYTAEARVKVLENPAPEVHIEPADANLFIDDTALYKAVVADGKTVETVGWEITEGQSYAKTDTAGLGDLECNVTGLATGQAVLTFKFNWYGNTLSVSTTINVMRNIDKVSVKILPENPQISEGESVQLTTEPVGCEPEEIEFVSWLSSNTKTATIDETGLVKGVKYGSSTIYYFYKICGKTKLAQTTLEVVNGVVVTITPEEEVNIAGGPDNTSVQLGYKVSGGKEITDVEWSSDWYLKVDQTGLVTAKEGCAGVYTVTLSYKYNGEANSVTKDIGAFVVTVKMPSFTSYFQTKKTLLVEYNSPMASMIRNGVVKILTPDTIVRNGTSGPYSIFVDNVGEGKEAAKFTFDLTDANGQFPGRHIDFKELESYGEAEIEFTPTISPDSITGTVGKQAPIEINITRGGLECEITKVEPEDTSVVTVWGITMFKGNKVGDTNFIVTYKPKNVDKEFTAKIPVHIK
ncbi:MAG: Ig-like domain-containing protein, partial [Armatimonadetes bacterium]|nr:Ig-like domain-containing protein [Candidatus Hippobium faecium]